MIAKTLLLDQITKIVKTIGLEIIPKQHQKNPWNKIVKMTKIKLKEHEIVQGQFQKLQQTNMTSPSDQMTVHSDPETVQDQLLKSLKETNLIDREIILTDLRIGLKSVQGLRRILLEVQMLPEFQKLQRPQKKPKRQK